MYIVARHQHKSLLATSDNADRQVSFVSCFKSTKYTVVTWQTKAKLVSTKQALTSDNLQCSSDERVKRDLQARDQGILAGSQDKSNYCRPCADDMSQQ
jgi:hypothetical protein